MALRHPDRTPLCFSVCVRERGRERRWGERGREGGERERRGERGEEERGGGREK